MRDERKKKRGTFEVALAAAAASRKTKAIVNVASPKAASLYWPLNFIQYS